MSRKNRDVMLAKFRHRIIEAVFWKTTVLYCTVFLFVWGVAVLAMRAGGWERVLDAAIPVPFFGNAYGSGMLTIGLFGLFAGIPAAWFIARRRVPRDRKLIAVLDKHNESGGLLMTSLETEIGEWEAELAKVSVPETRWNGRRTLSILALAFCFAATSLFVPVANALVNTQQRLNVDDQIRKLTTQLDTLEEENLLSVEEVKSVKLELEKIEKNAEGDGPVKTFDALDHLANQLAKKAAEVAEQAEKDAETLAAAEAISEAIQQMSNELSEQESKDLMEGLAQSLEQMLKENENLAKALQKSLEDEEKNKNGEQSKNESKEEKEKKDAMKEALKKMLAENDCQNMTPEMLQQLCEAMKQCRGDCQRMCENLQNAGFPVDEEMLKKMMEGKTDKEQIERELSELWAYMQGCQGGDCEGGERECKSNISPRWTEKQDWTTDPNAGPGDTRFEKDPDTEGAEFKATALPPAELEELLKSQKIGVTIGRPEENTQGFSSDQGGALSETGGVIGTAHGHTVYPQHRGAVKRYYEK